ncbi:MAG: DUF1963 domain-containing protein [Planctomycetota bacterium]|nr:DUF1963 domain-containing protein [Planctomycetota bacterium]
MDTKEVRSQLAHWVELNQRSAWIPEIEAGEGRRVDSKYGGLPWLKDENDWPDCGSCQRPLQFIFQLNLSELPEKLSDRFGAGLLQLFYCQYLEADDCDSDFLDASLAFVDLAKHSRIVHPDGDGFQGSHSQLIPAQRIVAWQDTLDYPRPAEHERLGLSYSYDWDNEQIRIECPRFDLVLDHLPIQENYPEAICDSLHHDKLGGWPAWIQNANYPRCPQCHEAMQFVYQVSSHGPLPIKFGENGCGYLTQCPKHKDIVTFSWDSLN